MTPARHSVKTRDELIEVMVLHLRVGRTERQAAVRAESLLDEMEEDGLIVSWKSGYTLSPEREGVFNFDLLVPDHSEPARRTERAAA